MLNTNKPKVNQEQGGKEKCLFIKSDLISLIDFSKRK